MYTCTYIICICIKYNYTIQPYYYYYYSSECTQRDVDHNNLETIDGTEIFSAPQPNTSHGNHI